MKNKVLFSCVACLGFLECIGMENNNERENKVINPIITNLLPSGTSNKNESLNNSTKKTECSMGNKENEAGNFNKEGLQLQEEENVRKVKKELIFFIIKDSKKNKKGKAEKFYNNKEKLFLNRKRKESENESNAPENNGAGVNQGFITPPCSNVTFGEKICWAPKKRKTHSFLNNPGGTTNYNFFSKFVKVFPKRVFDSISLSCPLGSFFERQNSDESNGSTKE